MNTQFMDEDQIFKFILNLCYEQTEDFNIILIRELLKYLDLNEDQFKDIICRRD